MCRSVFVQSMLFILQFCKVSGDFMGEVLKEWNECGRKKNEKA